MTISSSSAERIVMLYHAAIRQGSLVTVDELLRLLPESTSEIDLEEAIASIPYLSSRFELNGGYLTERARASVAMPGVEELQNRVAARMNMVHAAYFVSLLRSNPFKMIAVSGSTSYGSASHSRDLDLFCVAPRGRLWLSLSEGLIMARVSDLFHRDAPKVCFSCIMDENYARFTFASERDALFARDALETKVVKGHALYGSLMKGAAWISTLFPVAYDRFLEPPASGEVGAPPSSWDLALNRVLSVFVGRFLRLKSTFLNRKLKTAGRGGDVFEVHSAEDHLIYESRRYADLRREYRAMLGDRNGEGA